MCEVQTAQYVPKDGLRIHELICGEEDENFEEPYTKEELARMTKFMVMQALDSDTIEFTYFSKNLVNKFLSSLQQLCFLIEALSGNGWVFLTLLLNSIGQCSTTYFDIYLYFCCPLPHDLNRLLFYKFGNEKVVASKVCFTPKQRYWTEVYYGVQESLATSGFKVKNLLLNDPTNFDGDQLVRDMVIWRERRIEARRYMIFLIKVGELLVVVAAIITALTNSNVQNWFAVISKLYAFMHHALTLADPDIDVFEQDLHELQVSFSPFAPSLRAYKNSTVHVLRCDIPNIDILLKSLNPLYRDKFEADRDAAAEFFTMMLKANQFSQFPPNRSRFTQMNLGLGEIKSRAYMHTSDYYDDQYSRVNAHSRDAVTGRDENDYHSKGDYREPLV